jgi:acyl-CoA reductase-like NAD-dependent aldehyde dehydrogenase
VSDFILPLLKKGDYINGSFVNPEVTNGYINAANPGNRDDLIGRFPFSFVNAKKGIVYAKEALPKWQNKSISERIEHIRDFRTQLERRQKIIIATLTREIGIPTWEARQEVVETMHQIDALINAAPIRFASQQTPNGSSEIQHLPIGVLVLITPLNLPFQSSAFFSVAALLSGNTIIHNPSKYAPGIGQAVAELWDRCRLPRGVYNMVQGPGSAFGQRLITNNLVDGAIFAGSHKVAKEIRQNSDIPPEFPLIMFMGGKSAAIVLDDADLETAARAILSGAFRATGQRPSAIARVFVSSKICPSLLDLLSKAADQINIGYGDEQGIYMGPLASEQIRKRYHRFGRALLSYNHEAILETKNIDYERRGFYVRPAIYRINWTNGAPILDEEPAGPILLVYEVHSVQEAIDLHNRCSFRRMTAIFTANERIDLDEVVGQLQTGAIFVNQTPHESHLPVSAMGRASNGNIMGVGLLDLLSRRRAIFRPRNTLNTENSGQQK